MRACKTQKWARTLLQKGPKQHPGSEQGLTQAHQAQGSRGRDLAGVWLPFCPRPGLWEGHHHACHPSEDLEGHGSPQTAEHMCFPAGHSWLGQTAQNRRISFEDLRSSFRDQVQSPGDEGGWGRGDGPIAYPEKVQGQNRTVSHFVSQCHPMPRTWLPKSMPKGDFSPIFHKMTKWSTQRLRYSK